MSAGPSIAMLSHLASENAPTGAERSLALLAAGLRSRGYRIGVAAPGAWSLADGLEESGVEVRRIDCRVCWLTYYNPEPWPIALFKRARFALSGAGERRIERWLRSWQPDLVHVNCLPHVRGASAAARIGIPVIWHLREILPPGRRRRWFAGQLSRLATRIVAVSEAAGQWVRDEGLGERLSVIHNGVEVPRRIPDRAESRNALGLPAEGFLIAYLGQLTPHKGAMDFIDAAKRSAARRSDLRFVLAGSGPAGYVERLRRASGGGNAEDPIRWVPPQADVQPLLAAADAVCLPTLTPDPFPRTVLEAMAAGRPVAAYRGGGVEEMLQPGVTGLLVDRSDVEGLAEAFARLAAEREASRRMGEAGRSIAAGRFSIDKHLDAMERLFRGVMERA